MRGDKSYPPSRKHETTRMPQRGIRTCPGNHDLDQRCRCAHHVRIVPCGCLLVLDLRDANTHGKQPNGRCQNSPHTTINFADQGERSDCVRPIPNRPIGFLLHPHDNGSSNKTPHGGVSGHYGPSNRGYSSRAHFRGQLHGGVVARWQWLDVKRGAEFMIGVFAVGMLCGGAAGHAV